MLIASYVPALEGGAERQCRLLADALKCRGYTIDVVTIRKSLSHEDNEDIEGIRIHRLGRLDPVAMSINRFIRLCLYIVLKLKNSSSTGHTDQQVQAVSFWLSLPSVWISRLEFLISIYLFALKNRKSFDVLHVHESGWLAGIGVSLGKLWNIPVICKESTAPALRPVSYDTPFRKVLNRKRNIADAWLAQTASIRTELNTLGIPNGRSHLLPNGVLLPLQRANPAHSQNVLYVGNLTQGSAWKAFDILFDAWIRVARAEPEARLTVVGDGSPDLWIQILQRHHVESTVHFTGRLSDPSQMYRVSGIFVLPSRIEGMSNALLEAMSWGLACVVSDIPGNRAVIDNELNGLIVPVNDVPALAEAIIRLLNDPTLRASLGCQARKKAEGKYDIHRVADRLVEIYQLVTDRENGPYRQTINDEYNH